jgi:type III secretion system low calcium response chaperone LcrH/SycD
VFLNLAADEKTDHLANTLMERNIMSELYPMPSNNDAVDADQDDEGSQVESISNLLQKLVNGATLKDAYSISDDIMEAIYAHAYNFYQKKRLDDAKAFFRFLCAYDAYNAKYAMGLGAVYQQQKNYAQATQMYLLAFLLDDKHYQPLFYAGQCYLNLKDKPQAEQCFSKIVQGDAPAALKSQAQAYLNAIQPAQKNEAPVEA